MWKLMCDTIYHIYTCAYIRVHTYTYICIYKIKNTPFQSIMHGKQTTMFYLCKDIFIRNIFFRLAASHTHDQVAQLIASLLIKGIKFIPLDSLLDCFDLKTYFKLIKTSKLL